MHIKTLYQINARNTYVAKNLQFIMQSTFPGVLTGENVITVGTIFQAWFKIWIHDSMNHCFDFHSECSSFQLINLWKYNLYNLCLGNKNHDCWRSWQVDWLLSEKLLLYSAATAITLSHANFTVTVTLSSCFFLFMNEYLFWFFRSAHTTFNTLFSG